MKSTSRVLTRSVRFVRETAAAVGLASVMLGSAVLMGVAMVGDLAWVSHQRSMLEDALDAGGIAGFKEMAVLASDATEEVQAQQAQNIKDTIKRYILANVPEAYREELGKTLTVKIKQKRKQEYVEVRVKAKLKGAILGSWGEVLKNIATETSLAVTRDIVPVDVVLALDLTHSMAYSISNARRDAGSTPTEDRRITATKEAATTLVAALKTAGGDNVAVGLVPYTTVVNVGESRSGWLKGIRVLPPELANLYTAWKGCVLHRSTPNDLSITTPADAKFPSYFKPMDRVWNAREQKSESRWVSRHGPQQNCIGSPIIPLTKDHDAIQKEIKDLKMWDSAGTMVHLGVQWGRRVLAPSWRVSWGLEAAQAGRERKKVLVLLTDGANNVGMGSYSALGTPGLKDRNRDVRKSKLDKMTRTHCNNARNEGIDIYAVSAVPKNSSSAKAIRSLFVDCTGSRDKVFDTGSPEALTDAFLKIGKAVGAMRRVKPQG